MDAVGLATPPREWYRNVRALRASLAIEVLRSTGLVQRIDHWSLAARGIDREALPSVHWRGMSSRWRQIRASPHDKGL
jgi:hypothetical protein